MLLIPSFASAAALIFDDGTIISGSNQEMQPTRSVCVRSGFNPVCCRFAAPGKKNNQNGGCRHKKITKTSRRPPAVDLADKCWWNLNPAKTKPIELIMLGPDKKWIKAPSAASILRLVFSKESLDI